MKKGQGLSLNTIIIAAIVLIVLIVLWAIFTGRIGGFNEGVQSTTESEDSCKQLCGSVGLYDGPKSYLADQVIADTNNQGCNDNDKDIRILDNVEGTSVPQVCCCKAKT